MISRDTAVRLLSFATSWGKRSAVMAAFLDTPCDEENFHGTWRDFLTTPENDHGSLVEVRDKGNKKKPPDKKKAYVGGRYGVALEEAVKAEMRGQHGAAGEVIELLAMKSGSHPMGAADIMKAAERTEEKTKKQLDAVRKVHTVHKVHMTFL
eukprot:Skav216908  [mRNA]  locus=scaffold685:248675:256076:- [translate_table: standard]